MFVYHVCAAVFSPLNRFAVSAPRTAIHWLDCLVECDEKIQNAEGLERVRKVVAWKIKEQNYKVVEPQDVVIQSLTFLHEIKGV